MKSHPLIKTLLAIAALALPLTASFAAERAHPLRLMTYNIRLDIASDGPNAWPRRRGWVAEQVRWLKPDLFGMQEVRPNQKAELIADLPGYRFFGEGREGKGEGEATPIAYDPARFDFLEGGTFWLSPTPETPSKGWDAAFPRIVTWARLRVRESRQTLLAMNTHWDHIGAVAREESAAQMVRWIQAHSKRCEPVLVFGDFNSALDTVQMRTLTQGPLALRDARGSSKSAPFGPEGTFNGFNIAATIPGAIDHVLVGEHVEVDRYAVFAQVIDGRVPSDHFPVLVELRLEACSARPARDAAGAGR
jgi:endonuclease/exonuclease/phosphatase family metal-dependent hydrolase